MYERIECVVCGGNNNSTRAIFSKTITVKKKRSGRWIGGEVNAEKIC